MRHSEIQAVFAFARIECRSLLYPMARHGAKIMRFQVPKSTTNVAPNSALNPRKGVCGNHRTDLLRDITLRRSIPVDILAQRSLAALDLRPDSSPQRILPPIIPLDLVRSVRIAEAVDIDPVVEISAFVVTSVEPVLLAVHIRFLSPCFAAGSSVPVIDMAAITPASKVGPLESVGTSVVDTAAWRDATARGDNVRDA